MRAATLFLLTGVLLAAQPLYAQQAAPPSTASSLRTALLYGSAPARPMTTPPQEVQDAWFAMDKAKHFAFSFLWTVGTQYALEDKFMLSEKQALPFSVASGVSIGAIKEFYDLHYGPTQYFSRRDLVVDAAGILAAAGFIWF